MNTGEGGDQGFLIKQRTTDVSSRFLLGWIEHTHGRVGESCLPPVCACTSLFVPFPAGRRERRRRRKWWAIARGTPRQEASTFSQTLLPSLWAERERGVESLLVHLSATSFHSTRNHTQPHTGCMPPPPLPCQGSPPTRQCHAARPTFPPVKSVTAVRLWELEL